MESYCIAGKISVILSLTTSFSVYAIGVRMFLSIARSFTAENGCKRSSHRKSSAVGCHCDCCNRCTLETARLSTSEKGSKEELQTCTKYRSCRCSSLHEIPSDSSAGSFVPVRGINEASARPFESCIFAWSGDLNASTRPINRESWENS